ncbi:MAG: STAS domain-containing protein [Clostridiales Family XIII bacterium]|jgi:anti-sigma B factor antagonist|nr:STAS domain-containing protein [Clostridiales Family XIII bacterium]
MSFAINGGFHEADHLWQFGLSGEIDISNASQLKTRLESAYSETPADIVLDLGNLNYIDSTGLGVIIGVYGGIKENGHRIILREPKENVKKLLRITSLDKVLCGE